MAEKTATYAIRLDSNVRETAQGDAAGLEQLKSSIGRNRDAVALLGRTLSSLKGTSDEVKSAREQLKAQIEAERGALTSNTLALLKQGTTVEQLAAKEKAAAAAVKEQAKATADAAKENAAAMAKEAEAAQQRTEQLTGAFKALTGALGVVVGVFTAAAAGVAALTVRFASWVLEAGNAARSAALMREAWTGSAVGAQHLGNQVDALARKLPTPKAQLDELAGSLSRSLLGTRVSGQGMVDTFNAVAGASAAMGDQAGRALEGIIERGKKSGRVGIGRFELQGTGLTRGDVATQLAKRLGVGVQQATLALAQGRVKVNDAAAAIRDAVQARFGEINAAKALDLGAIAEKLHENLSRLTTGVNLRPVLEGLKALAGMFDTTTVSGKNLKILVTFVGNALVGAFKVAAPIARAFFLNLELGALKIAIEVAKARNTVVAALGDMGKNFDLAGTASKYFHATVMGVVRPVSWAIQGMAAGLVTVIQTWRQVQDAVASAKQSFGGWVELGRDVVTGLVEGITSGISSVKETISGLADKIKGAFRDALGIHSPSLVFETYGKHTVAGYKRGVDKASSDAQGATDRMAPRAPPAASSPAPAPSAKGGAARTPVAVPPVVVHINVEVGAGAKGQEIAATLSAPGFLRDLTRTLEDALATSGLPLQSEAT